MVNPICTLENTLSYAKKEFEKLNLDKIKKTSLYLNIFEYYLMGTYPPLKALHPISIDETYKDASGIYNLYIHIPFCEQLCTFCHFAKEIDARESRVKSYLDGLHKEIDMVVEKLQHKAEIRTIFFGGGTPSILRAQQIKELFKHLNQVFNITKDAEITFELHPGISRQEDYEERIQMLKSCGVNRWVCGVQAMDDKILKKLNRGHNVEEVYKFIEILKRNDVTNLSLDLMYGLPYQTINNWYTSIVSLLTAGIDKYNIFPLMFKMSDPITFHYMKHPEIFPSEDDRFLMHFMAEYLFLQNGFNPGPIFYYSKSTLHSQQQKSKFEEIEEINLLPLGVSSFGYIGHTQFYNCLDIDDYLSSINNDQLPVFFGDTLEINERKRRNIMFSLRSDGIKISDYKMKFGEHPTERFKQEFDLLEELNFIIKDNERIKLTRHGSLFADSIGLLFVSDAVKDRIKNTNSNENKTIRRSLLEKYDFSPVSRINHHEAKGHFSNKITNVTDATN